MIINKSTITLVSTAITGVTTVVGLILNSNAENRRIELDAKNERLRTKSAIINSAITVLGTALVGGVGFLAKRKIEDKKITDKSSIVEHEDANNLKLLK